MCGIIGIIGKKDVAIPMISALKRLEYRGYDSAGIATLHEHKLERRRAKGKLGVLENLVENQPLVGKIGIGHTRWATHGAPVEKNAHPHMTENVALVHNGIIENFASLRKTLIEKGRQFSTDTDSEVVAHLLEVALETGISNEDAIFRVLGQIEGAFALAILFADDPDLIAVMRRGSPVAIGLGEGENFVGSDAIALAPFTNKIIYLADNDVAFIKHDEVKIFDQNRAPQNREVQFSDASMLLIDKGNHRHFMAKEIHEQPTVVAQTLAHYLDMNSGELYLGDELKIDFSTLDRIAISACGTAFFAGLISKYWFEQTARIPVDIDIASEFRYREVPMTKGGLSLFISQSGETADTLATLRYCKEQGQQIGAVCNVSQSTIARESDIVFSTLAGPEIGVASTKAFTCQLMTLACIVIAAAKQRGTLSQKEYQTRIEALTSVPRHMNEALESEAHIIELAKDLSKMKHVLYLGRGTSFPLALEGALKFKEISYIHAEAYAAGELKHGPIALIDENLPVVVIAPYDHLFEKTHSNIQEVAARGGQIILITDKKGAQEVSTETVSTIIMPEVHPFIAPLIHAIPMQLLAYHTANILGTDIDQPRNLAKSVTVE